MAATTESITTVTDGTFAEMVLASDLPVVVDFWAPWCPPCGKIATILGELAEEFSGRLVVAAINTDDNPAATREYGVMSLPTLLVFRCGEVVGSIVGARPKGFLRQALGEHVHS